MLHVFVLLKSLSRVSKCNVFGALTSFHTPSLKKVESRQMSMERKSTRKKQEITEKNELIKRWKETEMENRMKKNLEWEKERFSHYLNYSQNIFPMLVLLSSVYQVIIFICLSSNYIDIQGTYSFYTSPELIRYIWYSKNPQSHYIDEIRNK